MAYNLKDPEEVKEYLKNLHIEYKFGCYSEKNPEACHLLGDFTDQLKRDYKKSSELYKTNCDERNYGRSCGKFGDYVFLGKGCKKDEDMAYRYMKKGCELNDGISCEHGGIYAIINEKVKEKDKETQIAKGIEMLTKACLTYNTEKSCYFLAGVYLRGIEGYVKKDFMQAYKMSLKSCENGNPYACANVAQMFERGEGTTQDSKMAASYKQRAQVLFDELQSGRGELQFQQGI